MNDLVFYGGNAGAVFGNQQFTMRNLSFYNSVTAINQLWDWGWTYKSISINNCSIGLVGFQPCRYALRTVLTRE